jgi:acyl carrier protein
MILVHDTSQRIINILSLELGITTNKITPECHLIKDLDADSIDTVNIIASINTEFRIHLTMKQAEKINSVKELIRSVKKMQ